MNSDTFWALVRHEYKWKGSWKKQSRYRLSGWWRFAYFAFLAIVVFGIATYLAATKGIHLENLWYASTGLPYMIAFFGVGIMKREWENDTIGWWLTLPYSRLSLLASKWLAVFLQVMTMLIGLFLLGTIYTLVVAIVLSHYTLADVQTFMTVGLNWLVLLAGFSPLLLAMGILTAFTQYSRLRPLSPFFWAIFMTGGSFLYWSGGLTPIGDVFEQFTGGVTAILLPYSWIVYALMALSWAASYVIIRINAYFLERKLD